MLDFFVEQLSLPTCTGICHITYYIQYATISRKDTMVASACKKNIYINPARNEFALLEAF